MKNCVFIGIGGFLGATSRYLGQSLNINLQGSGLPISTLIINISGCFILALFLTLTLEALKIDKSLQLAISTGFLGSYTTFSTFCKEVVLLILGKQYISAFSYLFLSVLLGLAAALLGYLSAKRIISRIKKTGKSNFGIFSVINKEGNKQ